MSAAPSRGSPMPIWLHLTLTILAEFAAFIVGALGAFFVLMPRLAVEGFAMFVALALCAFVPVFLARGAMRWFVAARCPQCAGQSRCEGSRPICYRCKQCGHLHQTSVYEGGHRHGR